MITAVVAFWIYAGLTLFGSASRALEIGQWVAEFAVACSLGVTIAVLIHELGHVVLGLLAGLRFHYLCVGGLKLEKTPKGLRLGWDEDRDKGAASLVPRSLDRLRERMLICSAGGFVGSLVAAGIGWAGIQGRLSMDTWSGRMLAEFFFTLLAISVMHLYWALDMRPRETPNDGQNVWGLFRRNEIGRQKVASHALYFGMGTRDEARFVDIVRQYGPDADVDYLAAHLPALTKEGWLTARAEVEHVLFEGEPAVSRRIHAAMAYGRAKTDVARGRELLPPFASVGESDRVDWFYAAVLLASGAEEWSEVRALSQEALGASDLAAETQKWFLRYHEKAEEKVKKRNLDDTVEATVPAT